MKATELQIGDWVIFHDSGYASDGTTWEENRICQIDSIDEDVRVKWYDESGCKEDWPHVSTELLSPIPLTPEIIEKNGFKLDKEDGWWWLTPKIGITFWEEGNIELEFENKHSSVDIHIKYLHQLQHALRLFESEKEIEL